MHEAVRIQGATLTRDGAPLLQEFDLTVRFGDRVVVWGANGSGKSTLLAVLAGERSLDQGTLRRAPGLRIAWVPQEPRLLGSTLAAWAQRAAAPLRQAEADLRTLERAMAEGDESAADRYQQAWERFEALGGHRGEARIREALRRAAPNLAVDAPIDSQDRATLRALSLATALASRPELLIADEPTNDLSSREAARFAELVTASAGPLACVVATHDRAWAARVATVSLRLVHGALDLRRMPFDRHRHQLGVEARSHGRVRRMRERERERLQRAARTAQGHGSPSRTAAARSMARRAERADAALAALTAATHGRDLAAQPSSDAWRLAPSRAGAAEPVLSARRLRAEGSFDAVALDLMAHDALAIVPERGDGSEALLEMLAGSRASDDLRGHVRLRPGLRSVHLGGSWRGLTPGAPLLAQLQRFVREGRARSLLATCGLPAARHLAPPEELSGGERARAAVALLLAAEPDLALLDRPERDLDLLGIERLEGALADARTAVVAVTTDLRLADAMGGEVASLEGGRLVRWRGGVQGWRKRRARLLAPAPEEDEVTEPAAPAAVTAAEGDDATLERLEDLHAELEELLADPTLGSERTRERASAALARLTERRMEAYDARLPPAAPRFQARVAGLLVAADQGDEGAPLHFADTGLPTTPSLRMEGEVALLQLPEPVGAAWSPWARRAVLMAALQVVMTALYPTALQTPQRSSDEQRPGAPFEAVAGWWVATRERFLAQIGVAPVRGNDTPLARRRRRRRRKARNRRQGASPNSGRTRGKAR